MLSVEENEAVTRVGAGTPMGELMRRYWMPAFLSAEVPTPDCAPVRVRLLGEALIAFRDSSGKVGLLDEFCPHRLVSLWLGRNEENGLRCVYHGWKFDTEGTCVEQMNEPVPFREKIKAISYPCFEQGGVVFAYMGAADKTPPVPDFEYTRVPESHRAVSKVWQECNWLQALEGGIDTSHAPILHRAIREGGMGIALNSAFVQGKAPTLEVDVTDYGYRYTGVRMLGEDEQYVRGYHFIMPFTQIRPSQVINQGGASGRKPRVSGHHWVPIDDENTMVWNWHYSYGDASEPLSESEMSMESGGNGPRHVDANNDYRAVGTRRNNWNVDRERQRTENFTGIDGVNAQDRAVQESMGTIVPRWREHLGPADKAIITARRLLIEALKSLKSGETPLGANDRYYNIRAIDKVFSRAIPWREEILPEMYPGEAVREAVTVQ